MGLEENPIFELVVHFLKRVDEFVCVFNGWRVEELDFDEVGLMVVSECWLLN